MSHHPRLAVVGAGVIGTAVARELLRRSNGAEVTLFEKENHAAAHQTGHSVRVDSKETSA